MKISRSLLIALAIIASSSCLAQEGGAAGKIGLLAREIEQGWAHAKQHSAYDPVVSPDSRWIAFVLAGKVREEEGHFNPSSLWIFDRHSQKRRRLVLSRRTDDNTTNLRSLNHPVFAPDGRTLYFLSAAWVTSDALFKVDTVSGVHRYIAAANSAIVVRNGAYRGCIIISEHSYNNGPEGGSYERLVLIRPNGKRVMVLPEPNDGADATPWLKSHGWTAD